MTQRVSMVNNRQNTTKNVSSDSFGVMYFHDTLGLVWKLWGLGKLYNNKIELLEAYLKHPVV